MTDLVVFLVAVVVLAVVSVRVGMLLAPRLERWGAPREPDNEDPKPDDSR